MNKKKFEIKNLKEIAEDAGKVALGLGTMAGEKAKPVAEKIGKGLKIKANPEDKAEKKAELTGPETQEAASETPDGFDVAKTLNTVIEGAYCDFELSDKKGLLYVGEKEISRMNCESYDITTTGETVERIKERFAEYRKRCINPLMKFTTEKYIIICWRNGDKSIACVDSSKYDQIIKLLS